MCVEFAGRGSLWPAADLVLATVDGFIGSADGRRYGSFFRSLNGHNVVTVERREETPVNVSQKVPNAYLG